MTPEIVLDLLTDAFLLTVTMVALIVGPSLAIGLLVSMFQAATQINEQTLSFLPRLLITLGTIVVAGHWLLSKFMDLFRGLIMQIPQLIG